MCAQVLTIPGLLSVKQAAEKLGCGTNFIYGLIKDGYIKATPLPGRSRVLYTTEEELDHWLHSVKQSVQDVEV